MSLLKKIFGNQSDELLQNASETTVKESASGSESSKVSKNRINKHFQVKNHLISVGHIDSWTAIELYGATRLSAIIFNLRKSGYNIASVHNSAMDRNGNVTNFTKYVYKEK